MMPFEATAVLSSLAGMAEITKGAFETGRGKPAFTVAASAAADWSQRRPPPGHLI
jgi:hypothetical protein